MEQRIDTSVFQVVTFTKKIQKLESDLAEKATIPTPPARTARSKTIDPYSKAGEINAQRADTSNILNERIQKLENELVKCKTKYQQMV